MEYGNDSDLLSFKQLAQEFARDELAPYAHQWDKDHIFPLDTLRKAAQLGLASIYVREDVGGSQLGRLPAAIIFEELATACPSTAAFLSIHNMVAWLIDTYGSSEQRLQFLPPLVSMEQVASYCLTEPSSGSDAASLKTSAHREGDEYVINGSKAFISGGSVSDLYAVMVRTGEAGAKGISCILIPKETPGLSFGKLEKKLGWHSQPTSMLFFENCRVPVANRVGEEGFGFKIALSALDGGRVNIAACSLGAAKAGLIASQRYLNEREQFQQKLAQFQALQFRFADMYTEYSAAQLMVHRAARSLDQNHPEKTLHCAMAKRFATDFGFQIVDQALQLHGGYGYLEDYPIERYFRDCRVHQILEGTNEIMRLIIARRILSDNFDING